MYEHATDIETMRITPPDELGRAMCAAWGLDAMYVRAIDVHWRPGELVWADVELLMSEGAAYQLLTLSVLKRESNDA